MLPFSQGHGSLIHLAKAGLGAGLVQGAEFGLIFLVSSSVFSRYSSSCLAASQLLGVGVQETYGVPPLKSGRRWMRRKMLAFLFSHLGAPLLPCKKGLSSSGKIVPWSSPFFGLVDRIILLVREHRPMVGTGLAGGGVGSRRSHDG